MSVSYISCIASYTTRRATQMAKFTTLFTIAALLLLLSSELTYAVRPEPAFSNNALKTAQHQVRFSSPPNYNLLVFFLVNLLLINEFQYRSYNMQEVEADNNNVEDGEVSCAGLEEQECLMRRTLAAHVDYIYTQKHHKP